MLRMIAYKFGDTRIDSLSAYHGLHNIKLKSIHTLVNGTPNKVCPVRTFTFELPNPKINLSETMSLDLGDVVKVGSISTDMEAGSYKSYSPTNISSRGQIDLTIKIYPDGKNSQAFDSLKVGDSIGVVSWPPPKMRKMRVPGKFVNLIVFGVGITEAIAVARGELEQKEAEVVTMLYANRYREDSFFHDKLDDLKLQYPGRFRVFYLYSREDEKSLGKGDMKGRVNADVLLKAFNFPTSAGQRNHSEQRFVIPGSKGMIKETWNKYLKKFDYNRIDHSLLVKNKFQGSKK